MLKRIRSTLHPDRYHGESAGRPFFEGWYYKIVDRAERHRFAIIPGVFHGEDPAEDHAFVQVLDGSAGRVEYFRYPVAEFRSDPDAFAIAVGPNRFSTDSLAIDLGDGKGGARGSLRFAGTVPWPVTLPSPGIMGWYAWAPFMECYHGVVSLDHSISGDLDLFGRAIDFGGGRGYTEKDWGRSFPAAWVWCQSNHFASVGTGLTASVAIIPWHRGAFPGFIIGLLHRGTLYRFASYTGARIERLDIGDEAIHWTVRDRRHQLALTLHRSRGGLLHAPNRIDMGRRIAESLDATVRVRLSPTDAPDQPILDDEGRGAGLEAAGDLPRLLDLYRAGS